VETMKTMTMETMGLEPTTLLANTPNLDGGER